MPDFFMEPYSGVLRRDYLGELNSVIMVHMPYDMVTLTGIVIWDGDSTESVETIQQIPAVWRGSTCLILQM